MMRKWTEIRWWPYGGDLELQKQVPTLRFTVRHVDTRERVSAIDLLFGIAKREIEHENVVQERKSLLALLPRTGRKPRA